jgi:hypothetical protein
LLDEGSFKFSLIIHNLDTITAIRNAIKAQTFYFDKEMIPVDMDFNKEIPMNTTDP